MMLDPKVGHAIFSVARVGPTWMLLVCWPKSLQTTDLQDRSPGLQV